MFNKYIITSNTEYYTPALKRIIDNTETLSDMAYILAFDT